MGMLLLRPRSESIWESNFTRYALHAMPTTVKERSLVELKVHDSMHLDAIE
jgi:hypothetical protein